MELSQLKSAPVPAIYKRGEESLNLMVEADMLTPQFLDEMSLLDESMGKGKKAGSLSAQARQFGFFVNVLSRVIVAWDLTIKQPEETFIPAPLTADFLRTLPVMILADLFEVCVQAGTPDKEDKKKSEDTTSQAVN